MDDVHNFQGERRAVRCLERRGGLVDAEMRGVVQRFAGEEGAAATVSQYVCVAGSPWLCGARRLACWTVACGFAAAFLGCGLHGCGCSGKKSALGAFLARL